MKNPPGYGSIVDLGKGRRRPIAVRVPNGKKFNKQGKEIIDYKYLGYFERTKQGKQEAQIMLANYNVIIPELSEPPVRTLGATIPKNESRLFR